MKIYDIRFIRIVYKWITHDFLFVYAFVYAFIVGSCLSSKVWNDIRWPTIKSQRWESSLEWFRSIRYKSVISSLHELAANPCSEIDFAYRKNSFFWYDAHFWPVWTLCVFINSSYVLFFCSFHSFCFCFCFRFSLFQSCACVSE